MRISPRSIRSSPAIDRSSVVLPQPLGPNRATIAPGATCRLTSRSTSAAPKLLSTPRTSIAVEVVVELVVEVPVAVRSGVPVAVFIPPDTVSAGCRTAPSLPYGSPPGTFVPMLATVVVLNWNGRRLLPDCLDALAKQDLDRALWETWVVDNGSTDDSVELLTREYPEVRVVETGANLGFAGGNNAALGMVDTPFVVLLNNDA